MNGARSVYNILSYQIPLGGFFSFLASFLNFFGADIDLSQFDSLSVSVMTVAGALLGVIVIIIIIKKIIPLL